MARARRPPAVARVLERVTKTVREHEMTEPGDRVLVMVSGGPDSVCLLYSLWHLRRLLKIQLEVFHFDHRLRAGSGADAAYVRRVAERLRVPFHLVVATDEPEPGMSVEAWARVRRGNAANAVRRRIGAQAMAEGHTLDDQAETVLLNLIRGTGIEGMSGIDLGWRRGARIEPLIDVRREEVEAFCRALHLRPRRDPMNEERRYLRVAIRRDVLPAIERATGRDVIEPITRTASVLRGDLGLLRRQTHDAYERVVRGRAGEDVTIDASALTELPVALALRVLRLAAYNALAMDDVGVFSNDALRAVLDLAAGRPGRSRDLPMGRVATRDRTHVTIRRRG
jgi:tRNA(Ile)-lysidine synthase